MMYLQVAGGFVLLLVAAEIMIRGAVALARRLGVSPMVIGMTIIAIGTSAPELVVSLDAALGGAPGLAVGNVVGSNIANVLMVLGAAALIRPIAKRDTPLTWDSFVVVLCTGLFIALAWGGELDLWRGIILLILFVAFLGSSYWRDMNDPEAKAERLAEVEEMGNVPDNIAISLGLTVAGLIGIAIGADLLVNGGVEVARAFDVPEEVIGLTIFAIGTSLPELAASCVAAFRGHSDVAVGNIVGSNLFNILGIAGTVAVVVPLPVSAQMIGFDIWVMFAATLLFVPIIMGWFRFGRISGSIFLGLYVVYIASLVTGFGPSFVTG